MNSNENPPQLALSDIMHHMSPSPVPAEDSTTAEDSDMRDPYQNESRRGRGGSPEPLTAADVVAIRRRLHAVGFSLDRDQNELNLGEDLTRHSDGFGSATLREGELVNMVCCNPALLNIYNNNTKDCQILQLTDPLPVDSTQLERQADAISVLTSQRDFLVRQAEEDRDRWCSEREGWDRMAEALLSHRSRTGNSATREDVCFSYFFGLFILPKVVLVISFFSSNSKETQRRKVQLESENRALRDKVCIYYLTRRLPPIYPLKTSNYIDIFNSYKILRIDCLP